MARFEQLEKFESRFPDKMTVEELRRWKSYWTVHASSLAPKVRKQAMKRVYDIDKAIAAKMSQGE